MPRFCRNCGSEIPEGAAFCSGCGKSVPKEGPQKIEVNTPKFCRSCGKPLSPGAKFCRECGWKVGPSSGTGGRGPVTAAQETAAGQYAGSEGGKTRKRASFKPVIAVVTALAVFVCFVYPGYVRTKLFPGGTAHITETEGTGNGSGGTGIGSGNTGANPVSSGSGTPVYDGPKAELVIPASEYSLTGGADQIVLNQDNSPGAVALLSVRYDTKETSNAPEQKAEITTETGQASFDVAGGKLEVEIFPWNLENETDELIIRELPVKTDPESGQELVTYDISLASGQHTFQTSNMIRIPRTAAPDQDGSVIWFDEEQGRWQPAPFEYSEDGTCYEVYLDHFTDVTELKGDKNAAYYLGQEKDTPFIYNYVKGLPPEMQPIKVTASSLAGYLDTKKDLSHFLYDGVGDAALPGMVADLYGMDTALDAAMGLTNEGLGLPYNAKLVSTRLGNRYFGKDAAGGKLSAIGLTLVMGKVLSQYWHGGSFKDALDNNAKDLIAASLQTMGEYAPKIINWAMRSKIFKPLASIGTKWGGALLTRLGWGTAAAAVPVLGKALVVIGTVVAVWSVTDYILGKFPPETPFDLPQMAYREYLIYPRTVRGYENLSIQYTKGFNDAIISIVNNSDPARPDQMMEEIAALYDDFFNGFFNLSFQEQAGWYEKIFYRYTANSDRAISTKEVPYTGISESKKKEYIELYSAYLHKTTDIVLQRKIRDDYEKMKANLLSYLQTELVPAMNARLEFLAIDEAIAAKTREDKHMTFDKSRYSRYKTGKSLDEYASEMKIRFFTEDEDTGERKFITMPLFLPADGAWEDYSAKRFQPYPRENSDLIYECTAYHFLQIGFPDGVLFVGDNTPAMPDIPVKFSMPTPNRDGSYMIVLKLANEDIYGTWEIESAMKDFHMPMFDGLVSLQGQIVGNLGGQAPQEAVEQAQNYANQYYQAENQVVQSVAKGKMIIRPTDHESLVDVSVKFEGEAPLQEYDGSYNKQTMELILSPKETLYSFTGASEERNAENNAYHQKIESGTYDLRDFGLVPGMELKFSVGTDTEHRAMTFTGESALDNEYVTYTSVLSGTKISDEY